MSTEMGVRRGGGAALRRMRERRGRGLVLPLLGVLGVIGAGLLRPAAADGQGGGGASSVPSGALHAGGTTGERAMCEAARAEWVRAETSGPAGESVRECLKRLGRGRTDARVPLDQRYDLTTFGGPGDLQPVDCGDPRGADGTWYYAANLQRFSCGQRVRIVDAAREHCVVVEVADTGPHICVEEIARRPIWDVSPLAAQQLFGVKRVGWSSKRAVYAAPVPADTPLGPCEVPGAERAGAAGAGAGVGAACSAAEQCGFAGAVCLTEAQGWPGGYCSAPGCGAACSATDGDGRGAMVCAAAQVVGVPQCLGPCDFTRFEGGCRTGYCCGVPPEAEAGSERRVCLPAR